MDEFRQYLVDLADYYKERGEFFKQEGRDLVALRMKDHHQMTVDLIREFDYYKEKEE